MAISEQDYREMRSNSDAFYKAHINTSSTKAYEYGVLVVKNAFLVSGGGVFFTPAIIQMAENPNLKYAAVAGALFAAALLMALLANYLIYINWLLHEMVWEKHWQRDAIQIRKLAARELEGDASSLLELERDVQKKNNRINQTFYLPHIFAFLFVVSFVTACVLLYVSLGIID